MNILTFGVKIDPSGAESGSRAARASMDKLREALTDVKKAAGAASEALGKTSDKGAFGRVASMASAATRAVTGAFAGMVRAVTGSVTGITRALGAVGLAIDGLRMLTAPLRGFLADVIGNAADMETFRNQWAYILGSFDKAREKMASLQKFANATPFDLPGVTQAALMMADLKDAALAGEAGLKRVGDAAARANQPIQELASRITRLSGNLERGAGGGDELRALTEWRIFRPAAAARIAYLSTDAGNFKEAMKIVVAELDRSQNAMQLMAITWNGLTSTMADAWGALKTAIGEPLLEGLKPLLGDATKRIDGMTERIKTWAPAIKEFGLNLSAAFRVLTNEGGFTLTLRAAADTFIAVLTRGFEILGKMLANAFDIVAHKFGKALERLASPEFWRGVGEALVNGVNSALEALKGATSDNVTRMLGGEPESDKQGRLLNQEMQSEIDRAKLAQQNLSKGTYGPEYYSDPGLAESMYANDVVASVGLSQRIKALSGRISDSKVIDLTADAGPEWLSPMEINDSLGPLPQTDAMKRYDEQFGRAKVWVTIQQWLKQQVAEGIANAAAGNAGMNPNILLPPDGVTSSGGPQGELFPQIDREGTGAFLDEATGQTKELTDATLEYGDALNKSGEMAQAAFGKAGVGASKMIDHIMKARTTMDDMANQMVDSLTNNVGNAFADIITGAKSAKEAFADMANNIVGDIVKMITKLLVQYAIMKAIGFATGTPTVGFTSFATKSLSAGVFHTGGIVGMGGETRPMGAEVFAGAVRYHTGGNIGKNEVPAILEKGETVLTKDQAGVIARRLDGRGGESSKPANVTIINLSDPNAAQAELARNPDAILNLIAGNLPKVREMVHQKGQR